MMICTDGGEKQYILKISQSFPSAEFDVCIYLSECGHVDGKLFLDSVIYWIY